MAEKYYDIPIDHPLTDAKRKAIDKYLTQNAQLFPAETTHAWDKPPSQVLRLNTPPVKWEVKFGDANVEAWGAAPLWARLLFTKEKRAELKALIDELLLETGFVNGAAKSAKTAKTVKPAKKAK